MTIYRVGPDGATVFSPDGVVLVRLRPGQVVVPGASETLDGAEERHEELIEKRVRHYADKRVRVPEDKAR